MRLTRPIEPTPRRGRSVDVLHSTAEMAEDDVFNPERDIHDRDWQIAEMLVRADLAKLEILYTHAATLASRVKWMELMDPERARKTVADEELRGLVDRVVYDTGNRIQKDRGVRVIWADLHTRGIENPHPFELGDILEVIDHLLGSLASGKNHYFIADFEAAQDIRTCLQMYPDQRTVILERLNKRKFWQAVLSVLRRRELKGKGAVNGLRLAAELCLIDPAHVPEVKAVIMPNWRVVMEEFRQIQRIAERFELFDPKQASVAAHGGKLTAIIANEVYPALFHQFATALHILSADEAEIDGEGRIHVLPHRRPIVGGPKLPERSLVV